MNWGLVFITEQKLHIGDLCLRAVWQCWRSRAFSWWCNPRGLLRLEILLTQSALALIQEHTFVIVRLACDRFFPWPIFIEAPLSSLANGPQPWLQKLQLSALPLKRLPAKLKMPEKCTVCSSQNLTLGL